MASVGDSAGDSAEGSAGNGLDLLAGLIAAARRAGADAADAVLVNATSVSVQRRLGRTEHLERAEGRDLGLRVFVGQRAAIVSSTTVDPAGFADLAGRAVAMARVVPEDPFTGLAGEAAIGAVPDASLLDLDDPAEPDTAALIARAGAAEEAALSVQGVTNSEGAEAGFSRSEILLATSAGFAGRYVRTGHSISATALAGEGTGMQRDYDYSTAVHLADLDDPAAIGLSAGSRAVARLGPVRPKTAMLPVVYDPRVAGSLLGHLSAAVNGAAVARGTSFLKEKRGERIFAEGVFIHDDPRRRRGLRSRPFDGEGVATAPLTLVRDGVLMSWLLDARSARQLGLASTGSAARGTGGPPSPASSNLYLAAGLLSPAELMADIGEGLYVTELIGMGVNGVTGDYSRGAAGFMIRNGELAEPVAEITIAGNLVAMFAALVPANDLRFRRGTDAPTVRIDGMTMAGA
jgi:PmbA protein